MNRIRGRCDLNQKARAQQEYAASSSTIGRLAEPKSTNDALGSPDNQSCRCEPGWGVETSLLG